MNRKLLLLPAVAALLLAACGDSGYSGEPTGRIFFTTDRDADQNSEVYVMAADGSGATNLSNDPSADGGANLNPAGDRLVFISNRGGSLDLWVMAVGGGEPRQITDTPAIDASPFWSPDGKLIAHFSARDGSKGNLWLTDAETGSSGPLLDSVSPSPPEVACAGGTPRGWLDNETVLYQGTQGNLRATQICSVKRSGSGITVLYSEPGVVSGQPAISPDGEMFAFSSTRDGQFEIYVVNTDGTGLERLTSDPGRDADPAWSPDGQWIAFTSDRDGDLDIYIIRPDGSGLRQLTDNRATDVSPFWAP